MVRVSSFVDRGIDDYAIIRENDISQFRGSLVADFRMMIVTFVIFVIASRTKR
jgi:hypothetical protein